MAGIPAQYSGFLTFGIKLMLKDAVKADSAHDNTTLNLDDFNVHNRPEHDISMTRWDTDVPQQPGDNNPDLSLVHNLLHRVVAQGKNLTYTELNLWREDRYRQEKDRRKRGELKRPIRYGLKEKFLAAGECAFVMEIFGRNGNTDPATAYSFLAEQRMPEGWKAPALSSLRLTSGLLKCLIGEELPEKLLRWLGGEKAVEKAFEWANGNAEACPLCTTAVDEE